MKFEVSDLLFAGFPKYAMRDLSKEYGIEFFYEFAHIVTSFDFLQ